MKILVVDDDDFVLATIKKILCADGYDVKTASDGVKALELIESRHFDLIISDIMMPNMSGLSLLDIINRHYFSKMPVILISSLDKAEIILSALGMGAADFILKPVNFLELSIRVKKYLYKSENVREPKTLNG
jgi:two-component system, sensor histidine kinase ChiS